jgi:hypothetical protein
MNRLPSASPGDDAQLDALLGRFFKGEMPNPWPAFQPPAPRRTLPMPASRPEPPRRFVFGSRLALAASVALLMLCGWLLSGRFATPTVPTLPSVGPGGTADRNGGLPPLLGTPEVPPPEMKSPVKGKVSPLTLEQGKDGYTGGKVIAAEPPPKN